LLKSYPSPEIERWTRDRPVMTGVLDQDTHALTGYIQAGEDMLCALPEKRDRDVGGQHVAEHIHAGCRNLRSRFMRAHSVQIYDSLTNNRSKPLRLAELAAAAAEAFPNLVPTKAQITKELENVQLHKEGREIDQGIFFWGLLQSPPIGLDLANSMRRPTPAALICLDQFRRTGQLKLSSVHIERRAQAAHVTIQNEQFLNAEDTALMEDLETAVDLVLLDDQVHVGIFRGGVMTHPRYSGRRVFSAGLNLAHLYAGKISYVDFLLKRELGFISKIMRGLSFGNDDQAWRMSAYEKPWLAAVDSFAIGGGAQLLLAFDHVIAETGSFFSLPAAHEGIVPGAANLRLSRFSGSRIARQIILGGRRVAATDADARLLFDQVADPKDMDNAIAAGIATLDSNAVVANRRMLTLAEEPEDRFVAYMAAFALDQASRIYDVDVLTKAGEKWQRKR
jgi:(3,5-dihydroxyphenyl)acetyl-CoA 1,2-dioxygenase